jgi:hypothetical protein
MDANIYNKYSLISPSHLINKNKHLQMPDILPFRLVLTIFNIGKTRVIGWPNRCSLKGIIFRILAEPEMSDRKRDLRGTPF